MRSFNYSCVNDLTGKCGALEPPTIMLLDQICDFISCRVCFTQLGAPVLGVDMFNIVISSWRTVTLVCTKWPSLSLLSSFGLKSMLSDIDITIPACFFGSFA